jgi:hypothetical protein
MYDWCCSLTPKARSGLRSLARADGIARPKNRWQIRAKVRAFAETGARAKDITREKLATREGTAAAIRRQSRLRKRLTASHLSRTRRAWSELGATGHSEG